MPWEILVDSFLKFNESNFPAIWVVKIWIFRKRNSFWTFVALLSRLSNGSCLVCRVKAFSWEKLASFRWILRQADFRTTSSWSLFGKEPRRNLKNHIQSITNQIKVSKTANGSDFEILFLNLTTSGSASLFGLFIVQVVGSHSHNHAMSRCPPTA